MSPSLSHVTVRKHMGKIYKVQRKPGAVCPKSIASTSPQPRGNGLERKMALRIEKGQALGQGWGRNLWFNHEMQTSIGVEDVLSTLRPQWRWEGNLVTLRTEDRMRIEVLCWRPKA